MRGQARVRVRVDGEGPSRQNNPMNKMLVTSSSSGTLSVRKCWQNNPLNKMLVRVGVDVRVSVRTMGGRERDKWSKCFV